MYSFFTDLFGPIFTKEMVEMARRWRYYQNRIILGLVVLLVLFVTYEANRYRWVGGVYKPQSMPALAEHFFLGYLWVQYLAIFLFVPFFLTGVISGEREQKTLDLLFTTQLQDREIIFGKLGSRVTSMLMLILSGIPIIAITMLMGGVNPTTLLYAMIATLLNLFCTSALAIYMSTTTRTTIGALVRTYWWLLFWIILFPLIVILLTEFGLLLFQDAAVYISVQRAHYQHWGTLTFAITNPVTSFVASGDLSTANRMASMLGPCYFLWLLIIPFGIGCVLIYFSIRSVRHEPKSSYWLQQLRNAVRKPFSVLMHWLLLKPVTRHLFQLLPPDRAEVVLGKPVNNPLWFRSRVAYVYDREKHLQGAQKAAWFIAVLAVIGIAFLERNTLNSCIFAQMFLCWFWIGIFVAGCLVAGLSFANDRRNGFFEFVLVSPLSPKEVLWGTYLGVWRHIKSVYWLVAALTLLFALLGSYSISAALTSLTFGTVSLSLVILQGMICSLAARSIASALATAFLFPILFTIGLPTVGSLFSGNSAPLLIFMAVVGLPASCGLLWWRANCFTVSCFLCVSHLAVAVLFTFWFYDYAYLDQRPLMIINPGYLTMEMLDNRVNYGNSSGDFFYLAAVAFLFSMLATMIFHFWWASRNYETLSGRKEHPRKATLKQT